MCTAVTPRSWLLCRLTICYLLIGLWQIQKWEAPRLAPIHSNVEDMGLPVKWHARCGIPYTNDQSWDKFHIFGVVDVVSRITYQMWTTDNMGNVDWIIAHGAMGKSPLGSVQVCCVYLTEKFESRKLWNPRESTSTKAMNVGWKWIRDWIDGILKYL